MGLVMISFALPVIWMNERKQAKMYSLITKATKAVIRNCDSEDVMGGNNFELVHTMT
jgi:hypothetical protein